MTVAGRRCCAIPWAALAVCLANSAWPSDVATLRDGRELKGQLGRLPAGEIVFRAESVETPLPVGELRRVRLTRAGRRPVAGPTHRVALWGDQSLSGTVLGSADSAVQFRLPSGGTLGVPWNLVASISHYQDEAVLLSDDFEGKHVARPNTEGQLSGEQAASGRQAFRLRPGDGPLQYRLAQPVAAGRVEFLFFDDLRRVRAFEPRAALQFDTPELPRSLEIILGGDLESYAVLTPRGPAIAGLRVARKAGWHRIVVQFAGDRVTVAVDDAVLANADTALGSLRGVRFALVPTEVAGGDAAALRIDDLLVAQQVAPASTRQPSPDQDELLLANGDQHYGDLAELGRDAVSIGAEFGTVRVPWRDLFRVHCRQRPAVPKSGAGLRVRLMCDWGSSVVRPVGDTLEALLDDVPETTLQLRHLQLGRLELPRSAVREIEFFNRAQWLELDAGFHHLGNRVAPGFQVPYPEGSTRTWKFELPQAPATAWGVLYALEMEAMVPGAPYFDQLKNGELRTYLDINDTEVDFLNRRLALDRRTAQRVRIELPPGRLRAGENTLRIRQTPQKDFPDWFDHCGVYGLTLEWESSD